MVDFWLCLCYHQGMEDMTPMIPILTTIITSLGGVIGAYFAVKKGDREREVKDLEKSSIFVG